MRHILSSYKSLSSTPRPISILFTSARASRRGQTPIVRPPPRVTILVYAVSRPTPSAPSRHRIPAHSGPRDAPPTGPVHPAAVRLSGRGCAPRNQLHAWKLPDVGGRDREGVRPSAGAGHQRGDPVRPARLEGRDGVGRI